jgi:WD40 repeat protein
VPPQLQFPAYAVPPCRGPLHPPSDFSAEGAAEAGTADLASDAAPEATSQQQQQQALLLALTKGLPRSLAVLERAVGFGSPCGVRARITGVAVAAGAFRSIDGQLTEDAAAAVSGSVFALARQAMRIAGGASAANGLSDAAAVERPLRPRRRLVYPVGNVVAVADARIYEEQAVSSFAAGNSAANALAAVSHAAADEAVMLRNPLRSPDASPQGARGEEAPPTPAGLESSAAACLGGGAAATGRGAQVLYTGHVLPVSATASHPHGPLVASAQLPAAAAPAELHIWEASGGGLILPPVRLSALGDAAVVTHLEFSHCGRFLAVVSLDAGRGENKVDIVDFSTLARDCLSAHAAEVSAALAKGTAAPVFATQQWPSARIPVARPTSTLQMDVGGLSATVETIRIAAPLDGSGQSAFVAWGARCLRLLFVGAPGDGAAPLRLAEEAVLRPSDLSDNEQITSATVVGIAAGGSLTLAAGLSSGRLLILSNIRSRRARDDEEDEGEDGAPAAGRKTCSRVVSSSAVLALSACGGTAESGTLLVGCADGSVLAIADPAVACAADHDAAIRVGNVEAPVVSIHSWLAKDNAVVAAIGTRLGQLHSLRIPAPLKAPASPVGSGGRDSPLMDLAAEPVLALVQGTAPPAATCVAVHPSHGLSAMGTADGTITLWDTVEGRPCTVAQCVPSPAHSRIFTERDRRPVTSLDWSPDGSLLLVGYAAKGPVDSPLSPAPARTAGQGTPTADRLARPSTPVTPTPLSGRKSTGSSLKRPSLAQQALSAADEGEGGGVLVFRLQAPGSAKKGYEAKRPGLAFACFLPQTFRSSSVRCVKFSPVGVSASATTAAAMSSVATTPVKAVSSPTARTVTARAVIARSPSSRLGTPSRLRTPRASTGTFDGRFDSPPMDTPSSASTGTVLMFAAGLDSGAVDICLLDISLTSALPAVSISRRRILRPSAVGVAATPTPSSGSFGGSYSSPPAGAKRTPVGSPVAAGPGSESGSKSPALRIDWDVTGTFIQVATASYELMYFDAKAGTAIKQTSSMRDTVWASHNSMFGWSVAGAWRPGRPSTDRDGSVITHVCKSTRGQELLAVGRSNGEVSFYDFPAAPLIVNRSLSTPPEASSRVHSYPLAGAGFFGPDDSHFLSVSSQDGSVLVWRVIPEGRRFLQEGLWTRMVSKRLSAASAGDAESMDPDTWASALAFAGGLLHIANEQRLVLDDGQAVLRQLHAHSLLIDVPGGYEKAVESPQEEDEDDAATEMRKLQEAIARRVDATEREIAAEKEIITKRQDKKSTTMSAFRPSSTRLGKIRGSAAHSAASTPHPQPGPDAALALPESELVTDDVIPGTILRMQHSDDESDGE